MATYLSDYLTVSNMDDIIDLDDLQQQLDDFEADVMNDIDEVLALGFDANVTIEAHEDYEEYAEAREFCNEAKGYGDNVAIHASHFPEYAEDFAREVYEIPDHWPFDCIDWDMAADQLTMDYTELEWNGERYFVR